MTGYILLLERIGVNGQMLLYMFNGGHRNESKTLLVSCSHRSRRLDAFIFHTKQFDQNIAVFLVLNLVFYFLMNEYQENFDREVETTWCL